MSNQIGSRIHLTSNSEIRYEGLLHNIDIEANTVSLTNVRVFGTEGRKNGVDEVPPSDECFEIIVFRGSDIKDLTLFDKEPLEDPAIVRAERQQHSDPSSSYSPFQHNKGNSNNQRGDQYGRGGRQRSFYDNPQHERRGGGGRGGGRGGRRGGGDYGGGRGGGGGYRHGRHQENSHTGKDFRVDRSGNNRDMKEEFKEEFDFSRGREEFERDKKEFEAKEENKAKAYNKGSFFDTISCDQKESRMGREEMKKADTETFGPDMVGNMRNFRRRGRYRR